MPIPFIYMILVIDIDYAHLMEAQIGLVGGFHTLAMLYPVFERNREKHPPEYPTPGTCLFSRLRAYVRLLISILEPQCQKTGIISISVSNPKPGSRG